MEPKRIAMDTSKSVFTLHGVDGEDRVVLPGSQRASALGSRPKLHATAGRPRGVPHEASFVGTPPSHPTRTKPLRRRGRPHMGARACTRHSAWLPASSLTITASPSMPCAAMLPDSAPSVATRAGARLPSRPAMPSRSRCAAQAAAEAKRRTALSARRAISGPARARPRMQSSAASLTT
jgi:hypothetical protein